MILWHIFSFSTTNVIFSLQTLSYTKQIRSSVSANQLFSVGTLQPRICFCIWSLRPFQPVFSWWGCGFQLFIKKGLSIKVRMWNSVFYIDNFVMAMCDSIEVLFPLVTLYFEKDVLEALILSYLVTEFNLTVCSMMMMICGKEVSSFYSPSMTTYTPKLFQLLHRRNFVLSWNKSLAQENFLLWQSKSCFLFAWTMPSLHKWSWKPGQRFGHFFELGGFLVMLCCLIPA